MEGVKGEGGADRGAGNWWEATAEVGNKGERRGGLETSKRGAARGKEF